MSQENILAIIKWGPILLFLIIFLCGLLIGMIQGNRRVIKRLIYVAIYTTCVILLLPMTTRAIMTVEVNGVTVNSYVNEILTENETVNDLFSQVPALREIVLEYPSALVSMALFFVLMFVGLPLSFPLYWVYMIFYALISKLIFKYSRFQKDEEGKYIRTEKGKKIKKKKHHRVVAGVIKGSQYVIVTSMLFAPLGFVTRIYKEAQNTSERESLADITYFESFKDYLAYLDAYNNGFVGFVTDNPFNKAITNYLTQIDIDGNKTNVEEELTSVVKAAVYLEESGIIETLSTGADINTLDLTKLDVDKLELAITILFNAKSLDAVIGDGVNYVLNSYLSEQLVNLTGDTDIVSKLAYANSSEVKQDLLAVTGLLKEIINAQVLKHYQDNQGDVIKVINEVSTTDVEKILNKVLSIQILSKAMPGVLNGLLDDYGLVETLTREDNNEYVSLILDAVNLVKSLELTSMSALMEGDIVSNITNSLYKNGTIKNNTIDALAQLLSRVTSSEIFDDILVTQLNNVLSGMDIKLNAQMIANIKTKQEWKNELVVIDDLSTIYKDYTTENKVDFLRVNNLMNKLKDTKAMILAFPIAYKTIFPMMNIEIDPDKIVYIDYTKEDADEEEAKFYAYWKEQLVSLELISEYIAQLEITSIDGISLDLLKEEENQEVVANMLATAFDMDLLKSGVITYLDTMIGEMLSSYEIDLNEGAIAGVNSLVELYPNYVVIDEEEYNVDQDNKYYIDGAEYVVDGEELIPNTLNRVWLNEVKHLSVVVDTLTSSGDFTDQVTVSTILDAVDAMYLLKEVKVDLLLYAIDSTGLVDVSGINKSQIDFSKEKEVLINIISKMDTISGLGDINFKDMTSDEQEDLAYVLTNVIKSDVLSGVAIDAIVSAMTTGAGISHDEDTADSENAALIATIKAVTNWNEELEAIKELTSIDNAEDVSSALFETIESSEILGACKYNIMITMIKTVNESLTGDVESLVVPTITQLKAMVTVSGQEKSQYQLTKDLILDASSLENVDLSTMNDSDISKLSEVIEKMKLSSVFVGKYNEFVNGLADVLIDANINHDDETGSDDAKLITTINTVSDWEKELKAIKKVTTINGEEDVNDELFETVESSTILGACKYNIMITFIDSINEGFGDGETQLTRPSVELLKSTITVSGVTKSQYQLTKELIADVSKLSDLDLSTIDNNGIVDTADIIEKMKASVVFVPKYDEFVETLVDNITNADYGVEAQASGVDDWEKELTLLSNVTKGMNALKDIDKDSEDAADIIGSLLEAMDESSLITKSSSQNVANKILTDLLNDDNDHVVNKDDDKSWTETFEEILQA